MDSKERVKRSIKFNKPDRVPVLLYNKDFDQSDIIVVEVVKHWLGENKDISEWGFVWEKNNDTMGQPKNILIKEWADLQHLHVPLPDVKARMEEAVQTIDQYKSKYHVASLALSGFTIMTFLRGFINILEDLYFDRDNVERLADIVFGFEEEIIRSLKGKGFDAVAFFDDWGTQNSMIISPELWRDFFKPRYQKQFKIAHECGLDVYFHCCGYIKDIIPDFIEIGVDILNLSQPNIFDIAEIGREYGGKVCFLCPISYQTTSLNGSREEIFAEAKLLIDSFGRYDGGFIGYVEEYHSIGLSDENYQNCIDAFRTIC